MGQAVLWLVGPQGLSALLHLKHALALPHLLLPMLLASCMVCKTHHSQQHAFAHQSQQHTCAHHSQQHINYNKYGPARQLGALTTPIGSPSEHSTDKGESQWKHCSKGELADLMKHACTAPTQAATVQVVLLKVRVFPKMCFCSSFDE